MPHAVTHVLIAIILIELIRHYFVKDKRNFPLHYVLIGGLAGLLPDIDIIIYYMLSFFGFTISEVHRTFTHTLFVPLFFAALATIFHNFKSRKLGVHHLKLRNIFLVIAFGVLVHLLLDATLSGSVMPFYPLSTMPLGLNLLQYLPAPLQESIIPSIDAVLLVLWLVSMELRHKLSDFI